MPSDERRTKFHDDFVRHENSIEQFSENFDRADENEIVDQRTVGDNDGHREAIPMAQLLGRLRDRE